MESPKWNVSILRRCLTPLLSLVVLQSAQVGKVYGLSEEASGGSHGASSGGTTVPLGGGGCVTGLVSNGDGNAIYCRTDVGGAFRWAPVENNPQGYGTWISMSDYMVPLDTEDADKLVGLESIVTDSSLQPPLYVGVGNKIFASGDQGNIGTEVLSGQSIAPNSRTTEFFGKRLAVDPNNPELIWYGSINNGFQKGEHSRGDWTWTRVVADSVPFGVLTSNGSKAGVAFVLCDANGGRIITFVGVFDGGANPTTGGVYKTSDGIRWIKVPMALGEFKTPRRARMASKGRLPKGWSHHMRTPQIVAAPASPSNPAGGDVWVCDDSDYNGKGGGLWRSTDSASSWESVSDAGKATAVSFGKSKSGDGRAVYIYGYVHSALGVYLSGDYGTNWWKLADPTIKQVTAIAGDRQNYGRVFIGTDGRGVFQY